MASAPPHLLVHDKADSVGVVVVEGVLAGQELLGVHLADDSDFRIVGPRTIRPSATRWRSPTSPTGRT